MEKYVTYDDEIDCVTCDCTYTDGYWACNVKSTVLSYL